MLFYIQFNCFNLTDGDNPDEIPHFAAFHLTLRHSINFQGHKFEKKLYKMDNAILFKSIYELDNPSELIGLNVSKWYPLLHLYMDQSVTLAV